MIGLESREGIHLVMIEAKYLSEKSSYGDEGERPDDQHHLYLIPRAAFCPQVLVEALRGRVFLAAGADVFPYVSHS